MNFPKSAYADEQKREAGGACRFAPRKNARFRRLHNEFQYCEENRQGAEEDRKDRGPLIPFLIADSLAVTAAKWRMYRALQKR